jgi:hypothetical protein
MSCYKCVKEMYGGRGFATQPASSRLSISNFSGSFFQVPTITEGRTRNEDQIVAKPTMKTRTFRLGFGTSMALLGVCSWFAFVSPTKLAVLATFDPALQGWVVHRPPGYEICFLLFAALNVPAVIAAWVVMLLLDSTLAVLPEVRVITSFASAAIASAIWWRLIANWQTRRAMRSPYRRARLRGIFHRLLHRRASGVLVETLLAVG